ncbi:DUF2798 domain-containing protein [Shewanella acanthi]|uniref:DUF2798 domain-containing protein n=1 Tax=Shewanella acanthi TaxID=2864212 RepID=UPI001C655931|nr:DUF2798 domain-containing protein [Shewanella acanthi]QYJ80033.1 DUF2798 domain-containing protein [Shewanella acanthi]
MSDPNSQPNTSARTIFGTAKLPAKYANIVMPFFLSILMSCIVSGISTLNGVGTSPQFIDLWLTAWFISWIVAFPTLLFVLPLVRKLTAAFVELPK